jgi:hypothetical protein
MDCFMTKALCVLGLCFGSAIGEVSYSETDHTEKYILFEGLSSEHIALYAIHAEDKGISNHREKIHALKLKHWKHQYSPAYINCMIPRIDAQLEQWDSEHVGLPLEILLRTVSTHCLDFSPYTSPVLREGKGQYMYDDGSRLYYLETEQGLTMIRGFPD